MEPGIGKPGGSSVMDTTLSSESLNHATAPPFGSRETPFSVFGPWSPSAYSSNVTPLARSSRIASSMFVTTHPPRVCLPVPADGVW